MVTAGAFDGGEVGAGGEVVGVGAEFDEGFGVHQGSLVEVPSPLRGEFGLGGWFPRVARLCRFTRGYRPRARWGRGKWETPAWGRAFGGGIT